MFLAFIYENSRRFYWGFHLGTVIAEYQTGGYAHNENKSATKKNWYGNLGFIFIVGRWIRHELYGSGPGPVGSLAAGS